MAKSIPYNIWVTTPEGETYHLYTVFSDTQGLTIPQARTAAVDALQDIIDKLNTPGSDVITIEQGIVAPDQYHIRRWRRQESLE